MKRLLLVISILGYITASGQTTNTAYTFIDHQRTFPRINDALKRKEDGLKKQFEEKGFAWPEKYIYFSSFIYDSQFEVWIKYDKKEKFRLFKTYKVCALAGTLGPKRMQGDYQVPEGFYYINEFNPRSMYHLSLGLNYPNVSDRILSDAQSPGGDIYIHGSCVTTGCIPITDQQIEEVYILAAHARNEGQDFIPVHIFPVHFKNERSVTYLDRYLKTFQEYVPMAEELREAYDYFEAHHELPVVMVNRRGRYILDGKEKPKPVRQEVVVKKREPRQRVHFEPSELARVVDKLPMHPDGMQGFQRFLDAAAAEMAQYLEKEQEKTYIMIEFIIDSTGKPAYAKVLRGGNDELNDKLELMFETMPNWTPAVYKEQFVSKKLQQSLVISKYADNVLVRPESEASKTIDN